MPATAVNVPDHYCLLGRLGEGGFGDVFEAWDHRLGRRIAVKRMKAEPARKRPDGLRQEARLVASLRHASFVRIHSVEDDGACQSMLMELVLGATLSQLTRARPLPAAAALDIVRQVAAAMEEAHGAGIVHGDLKPANLMLEPGGRVRILDFGQARRLQPPAAAPLPDDGSGTIAYLSPERLWGEPASAQSDIYALGAVLYELVVGSRPFAGLSGLALAAAHLQSSSAAWPFPAALGQPVAALVRAMAASSLSRRLGSMRAVREAIAALG